MKGFLRRTCKAVIKFLRFSCGGMGRQRFSWEGGINVGVWHGDVAVSIFTYGVDAETAFAILSSAG